MESKFHCSQCDCSFTRKYIYTQHMKSKKHLKRSTQTDSMYLCACGRTYSHKKSLDYHQKTCSEPKTPTSGKTIRETVDEMRVQLQTCEKEREELKAQIESILEKGSAVTPVQSNMQHIEHQLEELKKANTELEKCNHEMQRGNVILRTKRKTIQANVRMSICNDQNNTCKQCEKELTEFYHIDHVVALRFGGTNEYENLQALCAECHSIKSTLESKLNLEIQTSIQNIINNYRPKPCNQT